MNDKDPNVFGKAIHFPLTKMLVKLSTNSNSHGQTMKQDLQVLCEFAILINMAGHGEIKLDSLPNAVTVIKTEFRGGEVGSSGNKGEGMSVDNSDQPYHVYLFYSSTGSRGYCHQSFDVSIAKGIVYLTFGFVVTSVMICSCLLPRVPLILDGCRTIKALARSLVQNAM